jgi:hypothetical protein
MHTSLVENGPSYSRDLVHKPVIFLSTLDAGKMSTSGHTLGFCRCEVLGSLEPFVAMAAELIPSTACSWEIQIIQKGSH